MLGRVSMRRGWMVGFGAIGLSGWAVVAPAQGPAENEGVHPAAVDLIPERPGIAPGQSLDIGIRFTIEDGWHTYWPGANDTGFGTTIETEAPEGYSVSAPAWPAPHRHVAPGNILDHVHEHAVMPIVTVTAPTDAEVGNTIDIGFDLAWLVCKDVCLPGSEIATISIPVVSAQPPLIEANKTRFAEARARIPRRSGSGAVVTWRDAQVVIKRHGAARLAFYPDERCGAFENLIRKGDVPGDTLRLTLQDGQAQELSGVLEVFDDDGTSEVYELRETP